MSLAALQTVSNALILVGAILAALGTFGHYYFGQRIEAQKERVEREAQLAREAAEQNQAEQLRRKQILAKLRQTYILNRDGITSEMMSGLAPLPKEWVEEQLKQMGEQWRQDQYY